MKDTRRRHGHTNGRPKGKTSPVNPLQACRISGTTTGLWGIVGLFLLIATAGCASGSRFQQPPQQPSPTPTERPEQEGESQEPSGTDETAPQQGQKEPNLMTLEELKARMQEDSLRRQQVKEAMEKSLPEEMRARDTTQDTTVSERGQEPVDTLSLSGQQQQQQGQTGRQQPPQLQPQTQQGGARWITPQRANPRVVSVSFFNDPLPDVMKLFSEYSGYSILMSDEEEVQEQQITGEIQEQSWHVALETLLRAHDLRATQDPQTGIILIQSRGRALSERTPEIIRLKYVDAEAVLPTLETIIGADEENSADVINTINTSRGQDRNNTLLVYTSDSKLRDIKAMLQELDRKRPTVSIQAKMVFVNRSYLEKMGFSYQILPGGGVRDAFPGGGGDGGTGNGGDGDGGTGDGGDGTNGDGTSREPTVDVQQQIPFGGQGIGQGIPGFPGGGLGGNQQQSVFSLVHQLSLGDDVSLNVFFDVLQSTGIAEVEAAPVITTTSDLEATINVGEFFILPQLNPIVTASGFQTGFGTPTAFGSPGGFNQFGAGAGGFNQFGGNQFGGNQFGGGGRRGRTGGQFGQTGGQFTSRNVGGFGGGGVGNRTSSRFGGSSGGFSEFNTGTTLTVTPFVLPNRRIRMQIDIQREGGTLSATGGSLTGASQSAQTEVTVQNNESIVIGGLTVVEKSTTEAGVPVLKDLPLIGSIFETKRKAELYQDLIIVVTPHIIPDPEDDLFYQQARESGVYSQQPDLQNRGRFTGPATGGAAQPQAGPQTQQEMTPQGQGPKGQQDSANEQNGENGETGQARGGGADTKDCDDFLTFREARAFFQGARGPQADPHNLDADNDGTPCEDLPGAPEEEESGQQETDNN